MNSYKNTDSPYQIDNPSESERYTMLEYILKIQNRSDDLNNIIDLMSPPKDITNICKAGCAKNIKVAVIGAGEAGLAAAFELRKIGCNIVLFEASQRIGGRVYTHYFDRNRKYYGELGPMSIPISHETTWHYINLFKLETSPFVDYNYNSLFYVKDERAVNDASGISAKNNIYPKFNLSKIEGKKSWRELHERICKKYLSSFSAELRKELIQVKPEYSKNIKEIDKLNYRNAYENVDLSQDSISMLGYLDGKEQFFSLSLIEMLQKYYTADFEYNYRITDGMINLPQSLYEALCDKSEEGYKDINKEQLGKVEIKMGFPVSGIYDSSSKDKVILKYMDCRDNKETSEEFDYVICAIPFSSLRRIQIEPLFTNRKMQAISEMNYEIAHKIYLYLKNRFWEMGNASTKIVGGSSHTDLPLVSIYYPSDHAKAVANKYGKWILKHGASYKEAGALLAGYSWGQDAVRLGNENPELLLDDVMRYVERVHGLSLHYLDDKLIDYKSLIWSDVQYIWTGGALSKPGDKTLFSYNVTVPEMEDKVFFAGEHISQKHVSQQGALQSGMIAANEIAKRINDNAVNIKRS
ncbi:flavin monoamine oxidase family protein [Clostridium saccharobutylicum]|uniref:Putative L-amino-acid oxidase YobN n=1 Tax=Clostridium saccharobutylicum DSM 13864 TaxID=1345695 RepID=U5MX19_CLOSA|nr:NAD(P)/FAD-dependent oxidoreductase [Clostridium saccharobutylicum]AGX45140.1 putative L-amino-acid oxidase YobN [Clostridium saccharobutylicum DSM 13864]AQR92419.1 flavin-dependent L-tryptophan oxidase RebO precursor [Clostridium saccharobutylicum]AQS02322.1 flavin-dependent L-tryptophan oxidase RebO precursor [Clostridium saccharobutylicum]AQS16305.1 flavin-dependent L-tryptophan oxidase RebO precursor [Clostridium saccharobutylicum]MBA2904982.1 monoamine oxidase [Clostridium saccharobuty